MKTKFILITPAHNEEKLIEAAIESVLAQTIRPIKWVIVDDGSTDRTAEIVKRYTATHNFATYHRIERGHVNTYYARRVQVILSAIEVVEPLDYDFLAVLDADLTISPTYYEDVLRQFDRNPNLGIASGVYVNMVNGQIQKVVMDKSSTPGGLIMFRQACYESIGGCTVMPYGGEDTLANIRARMCGWQTRSFPDYVAIHHRPMGVRGVQGGAKILKGKFVQGLAEYHLWTHPVFMFAKSFRRMFIERPYFIASITRLLGFCWGYLRRGHRIVPQDVGRYVRKEQIRRLLRWWSDDWQQK